jgi:dUTP pyrophosphatase
MALHAYLMGSEMKTFDKDTRDEFNELGAAEKIAFVRGYFDTNGTVVKSLVHPKCTVKSTEALFRQVVKDIVNVPCVETNDGLVYSNINVIEFLHKLYKDATYFRFNRNYDDYKNMLYCGNQERFFRFTRTLDEAVAPQKAHVTDTGYDLCLVKKVKEENGMIMYDTGIAVQPPLGYYFELVGRSSISKTGYIVANSIGIIDASYTGSLKVALIKVNKDAPDIELPARLVQLIPRQLIHMDVIEVKDLSETQRGDGGFGSSGKDTIIC